MQSAEMPSAIGYVNTIDASRSGNFGVQSWVEIVAQFISLSRTSTSIREYLPIDSDITECDAVASAI